MKIGQIGYATFYCGVCHSWQWLQLGVIKMVTRRSFLKASGGLGALALLQGCELDGKDDSTSAAGSQQSDPPPSDPPPSDPPPSDPPPSDPPVTNTKIYDLPAQDPELHFLKRTSFGVSQADYDTIKQSGIDAYLDQQLNPASITDPAESAIGPLFPLLALSGAELYSRRMDGGFENDVKRELQSAVIHRACYGKRQLHELMVEFWSNHFSIDASSGVLRLFKVIDDREVIRPNALGKFRDLLHASAKSPAMLEYLDNDDNRKGGPNENYARELMELHTLGVDGGYTHEDVLEVARCFTGWRYIRDEISFTFTANRHDDDEKTVLGQIIPAGGGITDGEKVLDILLAHASTAKFLATKLVRRFVSDQPPQTLIDQVAQTYTDTDGDIKAMLRTIFSSPEFTSADDSKFTRPMEFTCAAVRAIAPDPDKFYPGRSIYNMLRLMEQLPFEWSPPDGYPDVMAYWLNSMGLTRRWQHAASFAETRDNGSSHAFELVNTAIKSDELVDELTAAVLHRPLTAEDRALLIAMVVGAGDPLRSLTEDELKTSSEKIVGLLLSSPYCQVR